ncbi:MAG: DUF192 domain-containing protein [Candidatus Paceibacterota bacterium]
MKAKQIMTGLIVVIVIIGAGFYYFRSPSIAPDSQEQVFAPQSLQSFSKTFQLISIQAPSGTIQAAVASTSEAEERGLSGQISMPSDSGMLFTFENPGSYGFWMKDMNFPLDLVWMSEDKSVVGITANLSPDTYPNVFLPPSDISYVLELNAGASQKFGIATGTSLIF